jgi:hypothetical protein
LVTPNAMRYRVLPMKKLATLILTLFFSLQSQASFGPTPSKNFEAGGDLSCESIETCKVPSYRTLQKIGEDFIAFSKERTLIIDQMETKIQAGTQTYGHHLETTFTNLGNTNYKGFLETGKHDYEALLEKLGLSQARQIVNGNSPFMNELKALQILLKKADANIQNSSSKTDQILAQKEKKKSYYTFRTNGSFTSFKNIDQVKNLINHYMLDQSLKAWMTSKEKNLRLIFNGCPVKVRRLIRKKRPSIKYDSQLKQLSFDVFNHPELVQSLVSNGRLLKVNCRLKANGKLLFDLDRKQAAINIDYQISHNKTPIVPLK